MRVYIRRSSQTGPGLTPHKYQLSVTVPGAYRWSSLTEEVQGAVSVLGCEARITSVAIALFCVKNVGAEGQGFAGGISSCVGGWGREEEAWGDSKASMKVLEHPLSFPTALRPALQPARGRWRQITNPLLPSHRPGLGRAGGGACHARGSVSLGVYFSAVRQRQGGEPRSDPARAAPESSCDSGSLCSLSPPAPWQPEHRVRVREEFPPPGHCS